MPDVSRACHALRRSESKRRRSFELSKTISDRSGAKGTGIVSDLLLGERSEVSGKSRTYSFFCSNFVLYQLMNGVIKRVF